MTSWKQDTTKLLRDEIAKRVVDPTWKITRPTKRSLRLKFTEVDDLYGILEFQISSRSDDKNLFFYVNLGISSEKFLRGRGFGPERPKSDSDCFDSIRVHCNLQHHDSDVTRYHINKSTIDEVDEMANFVDELYKCVKKNLEDWLIPKAAKIREKVNGEFEVK